MNGWIITLFLIFFAASVGLFWYLFKDDDELIDEIEQDLEGWWEYFNLEDEDDDDQDKTVNGDH